jgi:uncharacterized protein YqhQ
MAFANGVLMRGPHFWAWATEGKQVAYAPVRTLLDRHAVLRVPLLRSLVSFIEMMVLMVSLYRRSGLRRSARFAAFLGSALVMDLGLGWVIAYLVPSMLLANVLMAVLVFAMGLLAMRLGLGKNVWRYHGAEHKAVNAYEAGADLEDLDRVARCSRVHDRCGTNLAVIALFVTLVSYFVLQTLPFVLGGVYALLVIAVSLEFFRLIGRRPSSRASRVLLAGGRALQRSVTTSEPDPEHLRLACGALRVVLDLETGLRPEAASDCEQPGKAA